MRAGELGKEVTGVSEDEKRDTDMKSGEEGEKVQKSTSIKML